jgi:cell shape-determining protein MreD
VASAGLALGYYEGSLLGSLPGYFIFFRPILPFLVFCFLLKRPQAAYISAGIAGLTVDLMSAMPSGFAVARWLIIAFVIDIIQEYAITNRSLYGSWLLVFAARFFEGLLLSIVYVVSNFVLGRWFMPEPAAVQVITGLADLFIITVLFVSVTLLTKRFLTFIPFEKGRYGS